jgi:Flp pilus assembly protein TadG
MVVKTSKTKRKQVTSLGSTLIESVLALWTFAIMVGGIMEVGFAGMVANSLEFAAQRAARYASVRGSTSAHPALLSDIQTVAQQYATPLTPTVKVKWISSNSPGNTVQVQTIYSIVPRFLPLDSTAMNFTATAQQIIIQ